MADNVVGDPFVLPENKKRHIQFVLRGAKAPDPEASDQYPPITGSIYNLTREDFPVPELVLITLRDGLGCEKFGPFEKCRWTVPVVYRGVPFAFEYRKLGFVALTIEDKTTAEPLLSEFLVKLKKAVNATADAMKQLRQERVASLSVVVPNQFLNLDRMYRFFRRRAAESYQSLNPPFGSILQGSWEGSCYTTAMLNAYFSRLEHALVIMLPFADIDESGFNLLDHIGSNWDDKFRRLFDLDQHREAKQLYDRMKGVKERYRNPIVHGGFEKGGASLWFHVPTVGTLPASLVAVRESWSFSFIPIPEASYEQICELFDSVDTLLARTHTRYGWRFVESGLDAVFDGQTRDRYRQAMASEEAFEAMLKELIREMEYHWNMEY